MAAYTYLIVGGGMTGDGACKGIREHDENRSIGLFTEEAHEPYARPPLTKGLWKGKDENSIWRGTQDLAVDIHTGRKIVSLDLDAHGNRRRGERATRTSGCSSRPAELLVVSGARRTTSSTTARSTRTTGSGRSPETASA